MRPNSDALKIQTTLIIEEYYIKKFVFCRYAHWNAYTYNQQANPAAYPYGGTSSTSAPSSGTSSYSPYPENQSNSQYSYAPSSTVNPNDYYSQYGYSAPQPAAVYGEANGKLSFFLHEHSFFIIQLFF